MNGITHADVERYLYELLLPRDPLVLRLEQEAQEGARDDDRALARRDGPQSQTLARVLVRLQEAHARQDHQHND